jgi:hypothetical protein
MRRGVANVFFETLPDCFSMEVIPYVARDWLLVNHSFSVIAQRHLFDDERVRKCVTRSLSSMIRFAAMRDNERLLSYALSTFVFRHDDEDEAEPRVAVIAVGLIKACEYGALRTARLLLPLVLRYCLDRSRVIRSALYSACLEGHGHIIDFLLDDQRVTTMISAANVPLILMNAVKYDKILKRLLDCLPQGYPIVDEEDPFHVACSNGYLASAKLLLSHNYRTSIDYFRELEGAADMGHKDVVQWLLAGVPTATSTFRHQPKKAIFYAAARGEISLLRDILTQTTHLTSTNRWRGRPLVIASLLGHIEAVHLLVENISLIPHCDRSTALCHALKNSDNQTVISLCRFHSMFNVFRSWPTDNQSCVEWMHLICYGDMTMVLDQLLRREPRLFTRHMSVADCEKIIRLAFDYNRSSILDLLLTWPDFRALFGSEERLVHTIVRIPFIHVHNTIRRHFSHLLKKSRASVLAYVQDGYDRFSKSSKFDIFRHNWLDIVLCWPRALSVERREAGLE